ncbi:hypothetical protein IWX83_002764 [Flavobacterium sp. CG_9.1]|uniref:hypothetical protein n=1 Tax=Flavobacterium sp. CG_9.1 TaxID=2787728 RepID=UPI0018CBCB49|nr:hypothetical protein [Flavobacterium sp. CG_9.1]MBG6062957.1 hypothetical protein [Flavobacterium sp. CG_9.1]
MVVLEPLGGLANRMRVIASGLWLSNESNKKTGIIWALNSDLNCKFEDLFDPIKNMTIESNRPEFLRVRATNQVELKKRIKAWIKNKIVRVDYCIVNSDFKNLIWNNKINILEISKKNKCLYIQTCHEFGDNQKQLLKFKPVLQIQKIIDCQTIKFNNLTIGLHIRRSDNIIAIEQSPLELFIDKINYELKINKDSNFFLATDDINTEKNLKELFGEKILTYKKEIDRNTPQGIKDAVVDLYCLAKTNYIYGSYWSSYSEIAARIGQIELITLNNQDANIL